MNLQFCLQPAIHPLSYSATPFRFGKFVPPVSLLLLVILKSASIAQSSLVHETRDFQGGTADIFHYDSSRPPSREILIHFHGDPAVAAENFRQARVNAVLLVVNFRGLSSAYRRPFEDDPELFDELLQLASPAEKTSSDAPNGPATSQAWRTICLSSFSAGYGAVREILKVPDNFRRVDGILAADSIYASLREGTEHREVNESQMKDFLRYARLAAEGEKTFVITHSHVPTPYASTQDTANYLLSQLQISRTATTEAEQAQGMISHAHCGDLLILELAGDSAEAHMRHLREISRWWSRLPIRHMLPE